MLWGSSMLSEFHTSLSEVLTLWHCFKVKQCYICLIHILFLHFSISGFSQCVAPVHLGISQVKVCNEAPLQLWRRFWGDEERITSDRSDMGTMGHLVTSHSHSTHSWN